MARVAVIAVHGVADQPADESARAIAGLLGNLEGDSGPVYPRFDEHRVAITVRRIDVPNETESAPTFAQRAPKLRAGVNRAVQQNVDGSAPMDAGLEFMATLLAGYTPRGPDETVNTVVLRGTRTADGAAGAIDVDVYEVFWADLSRLGQSAFRIAGEIFQLLFHIGSLGVHTVSAAQAEEKGVGAERSWKVWAAAQRLAAESLSVYLPVVNLMFLGLVVVLATTEIGDAGVRPAAWLAGGLIVMVTAAQAWFTGRIPWKIGWTSPLLLLFGTTVMAYLSTRSAAPVPPIARQVLALEGALIAGLGITLVVRGYRQRRSNVTLAAIGWGTAFGAVLVAMVLRLGATPDGIRTAVYRVAELVYLALSGTWLVFFASAWVAFLAGLSVRRAARSNDRIRRAEWTARLTLTLPAACLMILSAFLWYGFAYASAQSLTCWRYEPTGLLVWVKANAAVTCPGAAAGAPGIVASEYLSSLVADGAALGFAPLIAMAAVAAVMAAYAIGPVVLTEVFPYQSREDGTRMGAWLDRGFLLMRRAGYLVFLGMIVMLPGGMALLLFDLPEQWSQPTQMVLAVTSGLLMPTAAGLLVFGGRLKSLALGFRSVVDVLLDVDNYLREHPRASAPRARICARFASILRHVYTQDYQAIVIIAHSQGTAIAADLLRFIKATRLEQSDPGLGRRNGRDIYFFTMGSPLRQLYGLRFPHLYRWARHEVQDRWTDPSTPIGPETAPNPADLDVIEWVNAYRAGDYVGRCLWRPDVCDFAYRAEPAALEQPWRIDRPLPVVESQTADPVNRREFCIGAGAHTHYWDRYAPEIARELDALICKSSRR